MTKLIQIIEIRKEKKNLTYNSNCIVRAIFRFGCIG